MPDAAHPGGWREDDSAVFIDYGQAFTPDRERQQEIVAELIAGVAPVRLVVELCSGAGDLARLLLQRLPEIRLRALDGSPRMLAATRQTCAAYADRLELQAFDLAAPDWRALYGDERAARKFEALRWNYFLWPDDNGIDHPSTVAEHILWLSAAGFEAVDLHWLLAGHAILSARKP